MIAGRILPANVSVIAATRYAREDGGRVFFTPGGQVIIRDRALPGWQRLGWAGFRQLGSARVNLMVALLMGALIFFAALTIAVVIGSYERPFL